MSILGCIADDFTGASDAASFLVKGGLNVILYNGVPADAQSDIASAEKVDAIVIALKSRTQETAEAVRDSLVAADFLKRVGVKQIYFKYCSTFDSTPKGNIGPVADALMTFTGAPYSILCPALPVNGRIVKNGILYVNGVPLDESPMKDHPLTPMWDANLDRLMEPQSRYHSYRIDGRDFSKAAELTAPMQEPFYLIPDYVNMEDGNRIAQAFQNLPLLTGGSGLLEPLAAIWAERTGVQTQIPDPETEGKILLLAGSCSSATLGQITYFQTNGYPSLKMDPLKLMNGEQTAEGIWQFVERESIHGHPVLIYSSDTPEKVKKYQKAGIENVAQLLENTIAQLAHRAVDAGFSRIIAAGGETSGAVTKALGFHAFYISKSIASGVPVMIPTENPKIRLVLKSGNFGQQDFFERAVVMTEKSERV